MKITVAQLNPIVGYISGNVDKMVSALAEASTAGSDLVVFPELFMIGYPPRDLLERPWLLDKIQEAVQYLTEVSARYPHTGILFGLPQGNKGTGKGLYNSALLVYQGQIIGSQHKSLLPIYDVFDEARYFDAALHIDTIPFKEEILGISICEDAWNDPGFWPQRRVYDLDPIEVLAKRGATILINLSASPFYAGKEDLRYNLISNHARRHSLPFVYVNQVGGNDELVFDGGSMCLGSDGNPIWMGPAFKEHVETIDMSSPGAASLYKTQDNISSIYDALVLGVRDYMFKCGFQMAVLGLSGGIDSALVACLAREAVGPDNVLAISMPSLYSSQGSVDDARKLAQTLDISFKVIPITPVYNIYRETFYQHWENRTAGMAEENIQARIRGNILMAFSNKYGYLVLSTGNKSELAVGYCTLYGDMSGGLGVLADVPKTLVYQLADYINRDQEIIPHEIIQKPPSAELKPDQVDQDILPPYEILDQILHYYIEEGFSVEKLNSLKYDPEVVKWVVDAVDRNEYKRRQAPIGLKVTTKAFGAGRRMPVAARFRHWD